MSNNGLTLNNITLFSTNFTDPVIKAQMEQRNRELINAIRIEEAYRRENNRNNQTQNFGYGTGISAGSSGCYIGRQAAYGWP